MSDYHKLEGGASQKDPLNKQDDKPTRLTRQQINRAIMDAQDESPLAFKAHLVDVLPFLKFCRRKKGKDFKKSIRKVLSKKLDIKIPKAEQDIEDEPFVMLGYGVNAYFNIIKYLGIMFFMITLFSIPIYTIYLGNTVDQLSGILNKLSLGNLGGSHIVKSNHFLSKNTTLECRKGLVMIDNPNYLWEKSFYEFGLVSSNIGQNFHVSKQSLKNDSLYKAEDDCLSNFNVKKFNDTMWDKCLGQEACSINIKDYLLDKNHLTCGLQASFFVQTACITPDSLYYNRQYACLGISSLGVFIYFFIVIFLDYIKSVQQNKYVDYDVKTISAADYSIEFDFEDEQYEWFKQHYYHKRNPMSELAQFKLYVQDEIENRINAMEDQGVDGDESPKRKKVAQITFAFDNTEMIQILKKRGDAIKAEKWNDVRKINEQISLIMKDQKKLDKLQTPCSCFATFETEEGYCRAYSINQQVEECIIPLSFGKFLGKNVEFQAASEPSDIIWENRHVEQSERFKRRVFVKIIITFMLAVSFGIIYFCAKSSIDLKSKYPPAICSSKDEEFKVKNVMDITKYQNAAFNEYYENEIEKKSKTYGRDLQCFCQWQKKNNVTNEELYAAPEDLEKIKDKKVEPIAICAIYFSDKLWSTALGTAISFIIIAVNTILKIITIKLVEFIQEDTLSEQLSSVTIYVFVAQFFNTAFILLLVNANLSEHRIPILRNVLQGNFYDYSPEWYEQVGFSIVKAMIINMITPYITLVTTMTIPKVKQILDGGKYYNTKKTSISGFKSVWGGGDYLIHFKYSQCLNVTFVSLLYGIGQPILFPIAALNFFNQWVCERITVAYYMKRPAALDNQLTETSISILKFAPICFVINGFWMMDNKQIFDNIWSFVDQADQNMKSGHFVSMDTQSSSPLQLISLMAVGIVILQASLGKLLTSFGFSMQQKEIEVDENNPMFFDTIKISTAQEMIIENRNMRKNYGFEMNDPDTITALKKATIPKQAMQGTPWYQPLTDSRYVNMFAYIGGFVLEREKLLEDHQQEECDNDERKQIRFEQSDLCVLLLNIGYIPDSVLKQISFDKDLWSSDFKRAMDTYKAGWQVETKKRWQYTKNAQTVKVRCSIENVDVDKNEIEENYIAFKREKEKSDQNLENFQKEFIENKMKKAFQKIGAKSASSAYKKI